MQVVRDNRTGKIYKTKWDIKKDKIRMLHSFAFIKAGALTPDEVMEEREKKCIDKWSFIEVLGVVDGRIASIRKCPYFTWLVVTEK